MLNATSGAVWNTIFIIDETVFHRVSRRGNKEFVQFLFISKSSASEVQSILYAAIDQKYISQEIFQSAYDQAELASKLDSGLIKYHNSKIKKPT